MKVLKSVGVVALVGASLSGAFWAYAGPERTFCVARAPQFDRDGPGYELINVVRGEAWATRDWTPEAYAAFSPPPSWVFWFKNDPRVGVADQSRFVRSPGCAQDGQYSYMTVFGRTFVLVARPHAINTGDGAQGLIHGATVEKHHVLRYAAGRTVTVLTNPAGQRFVAVTAPLNGAADAPELPDGWSIADREVKQDLEVALTGDVTVLRLTNGMSYQGPLPPGARPFGLASPKTTSPAPKHALRHGA